MQEEKEHHRHHMEHHEKEHDEGVGEKWRRDPFSAIFFGLIVLSAGILFVLAAQDYIWWSEWWMYFLICVGAIFIIETLVRWSVPEYRKPGAGRIIIGLVLVVIGSASLTARVIWPWIIVIVAIAIIIYGVTRVRRPE